MRYSTSVCRCNQDVLDVIGIIMSSLTPQIYLLRVTNSWQGHCNSFWCQLLQALNSPSPHEI